MRVLILAFALFVTVLPAITSAQSGENYLDRVVAADDRTACDETGWSMIESEMTTTLSDSYLLEHAACSNGEHDLALMAGCNEPMRQTLVEAGPDPGEAWIGCSVMVINGSVHDFILAPADFSLADKEGTPYPFSVAASIMGGPSALRVQNLPAGSDPIIGLVAFAIPDDLDPPYLLVWEPGVNGVALSPVWIVVDRLIELPDSLSSQEQESAATDSSSIIDCDDPYLQYTSPDCEDPYAQYAPPD
jgi:hypothetical protein